jgi:hypothetical protein
MIHLKIGIDPGIHLGWCVTITGKYKEIQMKGQLHEIETTDFWGGIKRLSELDKYNHHQDYKATVYIENPDLIKPTFPRNVSEVVMRKISQDVGKNKRDAQLLIEFCKNNNIPVHPVKPSSRTMTKLDAERFKMITGYSGQTSEHARDACMLVWGR